MLLKDLLRFSGYHAAFSLGAPAAKPLREPLAALAPPSGRSRYPDHAGSLNVTMCIRRWKLDAFTDAIKLIESYVFRRALCGKQTRGYWQVFANLAHQIDPDCPLQSLTVGLARQRDTYRFPDSSEFRQALTDGEVYWKRVCRELLDRLENDGSKEPTATSNYSIEHIMPQNEKLPGGVARDARC